MSSKRSLRIALTPQQQRAAGIASVLIVIMLVLGVAILAWASDWAGMYAHPEINSRGSAQIIRCHSSPAHLSVCDAVVTSWQDDSHEAKESIALIAYGHPVGSVEVVSRERTISTYLGNNRPYSYNEEVITPANQWVMPNWMRPIWVIGNVAVWFLAVLAMTKLVYRLVPGASTRREHPIREPKGASHSPRSRARGSASAPQEHPAHKIS